MSSDLIDANHKDWCKKCYQVHFPNERYPEPITQTESMKCDDCGLPYSEFGLDTTIPVSQYELIYSGACILCTNCMVKRASKLPGVIAARTVFEFAPGKEKV